MATQLIRRMHDAGVHVYFCINNAAAQFLDFADGTFKALGSATTPYLAATEHAGGAGAGKSYYDATLDLDVVHPGVTPLPITITAFERAGGTPAPATDEAISQPAGESIQRGDVIIVPVEPQFRICVKTTAGTAIQVETWLEAGGAPVPLFDLDPAATCVATIYLFGTGIPVITIDVDFTLNARGIFEAEYANPNFTADRLYDVDLTITSLGVDYSSRRSFTAVP
jgi:hypothetical protein